MRQQCPDPEQQGGNLSGQPLVTMGGGALPLPLPMPAQPATLTATRVATKATSTFFIGIPLCFTPRDAHFVPRCTVGRPLKPMVHRLRRQWGTSKGTVSLGTQLRGVRSKTCQRAAADRPPGTHHSPSISGLNSRAGGCAKASCAPRIAPVSTDKGASRSSMKLVSGVGGEGVSLPHGQASGSNG